MTRFNQSATTANGQYDMILTIFIPYQLIELELVLKRNSVAWDYEIGVFAWLDT